MPTRSSPEGPSRLCRTSPGPAWPASARAGFGAMGALSRSGSSCPFDARRDGFVLAEGAGALVLEDADSASRRGAEVLAELRGYASTADAYHVSAPEPDGRG